jgi:hypothetical protein
MGEPSRIRGLRHWEGLGEARQEKYLASLEALNISRTEHKPMREAAAEAGVSYGTAMRYVRSATERDAFGRTVARPADRLFRPMEIPTREGAVLRAVYGSRAASKLGGYEGALDRFLAGDDRALLPYEGKRVGGVALPTDPDVVEDMARRGILAELEPYAKSGR